MATNRSMPGCTEIPELAYPDVAAAAAWLCSVYGFRVRLRIADHRIQLAIGDGAVTLMRSPVVRLGQGGHGVMVRVPNVDAHHAQARAAGATIVRAPEDFPYGEQQYGSRDLAGHAWVFSQTIAPDVDPRDWGSEIEQGQS